MRSNRKWVFAALVVTLTLSTFGATASERDAEGPWGFWGAFEAFEQTWIAPVLGLIEGIFEKAGAVSSADGAPQPNDATGPRVSTESGG